MNKQQTRRVRRQLNRRPRKLPPPPGTSRNANEFNHRGGMVTDTSKQEGMAAYDRLHPAIRHALRYASQNFDPVQAYQLWVSWGDAHAVARYLRSL